MGSRKARSAGNCCGRGTLDLDGIMCVGLARPRDPILYFAYGSNLCLTQMRQRCPGFQVAFRAVAEGWRLWFPRYSSNWRGGVASIERRQGENVWGVVYRLTGNDWESLNACEGFEPGRACPINSYCWGDLQVRDDSGRDQTVGAYFANPQGDHKPSRAYLKLIFRGAREHRLPPEYLRALRRTVTE